MLPDVPARVGTQYLVARRALPQLRGVVKGIAPHGNLVGPDAEDEYTELFKRSRPAWTTYMPSGLHRLDFLPPRLRRFADWRGPAFTERILLAQTEGLVRSLWPPSSPNSAQ